MNDLLNTLYDYVLTQSESYLAVYPEYRDFCRRAAEKERSLRANLSRRRNSFWRTCWGNCGSGIRRSRRPLFRPPWRCAGS